MYLNTFNDVPRKLLIGVFISIFSLLPLRLYEIYQLSPYLLSNNENLNFLSDASTLLWVFRGFFIKACVSFIWLLFLVIFFIKRQKKFSKIFVGFALFEILFSLIKIGVFYYLTHNSYGFSLVILIMLAPISEWRNLGGMVLLIIFWVFFLNRIESVKTFFREEQ